MDAKSRECSDPRKDSSSILSDPHPFPASIGAVRPSRPFAVKNQWLGSLDQRIPRRRASDPECDPQMTADFRDSEVRKIICEHLPMSADKPLMDRARGGVAFRRKGQRFVRCPSPRPQRGHLQRTGARSPIGLEFEPFPLPRPHWGGPIFASIRVPSRLRISGSVRLIRGFPDSDLPIRSVIRR